MRKLVSIENISHIEPIHGADRIDRAIVKGWSTVVVKGQYSVGDRIIFCEVDSLMPEDPRWEFLSKDNWRVRTKTFRGQLSAGLVLSLDILTDEERRRIFDEHEDPASVLGVIKYEPPVPMGADIIGNFPSFIPKTDEERIQNLTDVFDLYQGHMFEVTEKLDGQSLTIFNFEDSIGVATRNNLVDHASENVYSKILSKYDLVNRLKSLGRDYALQGELVGTKINGNRHRLKENRFYVFNIFDIKDGRYLLPDERYLTLNLMNEIGSEGCYKMENVPIVVCPLKLDENYTVENLLLLADELYSSVSSEEDHVEGIVFKPFREMKFDLDGRNLASIPPKSFKVISDQYLIKHGL